MPPPQPTLISLQLPPTKPGSSTLAPVLHPRLRSTAWLSPLSHQVICPSHHPPLHCLITVRMSQSQQCLTIRSSKDYFLVRSHQNKCLCQTSSHCQSLLLWKKFLPLHLQYPLLPHIRCSQPPQCLSSARGSFKQT
jgi:hypothetical protein